MSSSQKQQKQLSYYDKVRAATGDAASDAGLSRVEVNQRALIDKILARYATQNAVYRELLQNSNDAGATKAEINFTTSESNANIVASVVYRNNGMPFRAQDWSRLQKIAEGNPDVSKVGAFGVGAYTMFSITEEPVIVSGDQVLLFTWRGDALYTKSAQANPEDISSEWTTFCLPSRDAYPLPDWREFGEFLTAALTFTAALKQVRVTVNGTERLSITKTILQAPRLVQTPAAASSSSSTSKAVLSFFSASNKDVVTSSPGGLFALQKDSVFESVVRVTVCVDQTDRSSADARYVSATAKTRISADMARRMERVTKKQPPPTVTVQAFLNFNSTTTVSSSGSSTHSLSQRIAQSFAPVTGKGRIFIGFRTSQTTGLAAHLQAPFVPTVEREAMDLQDAVLAKFNSELLEFGGILLRLTLEHTMRNVIDVAWQQHKQERQALEKKLLLELEQDKKTKKTAAAPTGNEAVESVLEVEEEEEEDEAASTTIMGFARFMARGVKKKIVSVAKSVETLIEGDGSQHLLYPPDPLPLAAEETQAIVLMSSFCPIQSTPDPFVGTLLAQGFSRCMPNSAPPVLTKSGVVPGNEARLPHYGIEGFVSDGVIRTIVYQNAEEYHTVIARCRKLNFDDLMKVVSNTVLEQEKCVNLIKWWSRFSKIESNINRSSMLGSRLKEVIRFRPDVINIKTISNCNGGDGSKEAIVNLNELLFFLEKDSHFARRDLPLPDTLVPAYLQDAIGLSALMSEALFGTWFNPLPIEIWADFISHDSCMVDAKPEDELTRVKVLTVLSQEYMRLFNSSDRSVFGGFCHGLLSDKRCIPFDSDVPTRFAADYPADLYLYSAELKAFDGIGSFHKVSGSLQSAGVTEAFLLQLGVRKSVSIDFLFSNLDKLNFSKDPRSLVEYLRTATLTRSDMNKLAGTQYLPSAADNDKKYAPSELYLPNEDLGIFPFIKTLHWPSEPTVAQKSPNGAFLAKLGMKSMPSLIVALSFCSGGDDMTEEQRIKGIDFVCDRLVPHGMYYGQYNSMGSEERKKFRFLPCIVKNAIVSGEPTSMRCSPVSCFSESSCSIMGFPVIDPKLGKNGKLYGSLFQCESEPPASLLLNQLTHLVAVAKDTLKKPNGNSLGDVGKRVDATFAEIFKYLSQRSSDLKYSSVAALQRESFIPCPIEGKIVWYRPEEVFFKRSDRGSDSLTEELFHVIEFYPFLAAAGVKEEATTKEIFTKMIESPDGVLRTLGSEKKYRALLRRIAADPPFALSRPSAEIKKAPFLLAYNVKPESSGDTTDDKLSYQLAKADDIFVVDNANYSRMFPVNRAPPETDLEDFYVTLGSRYISKAVERRFEVVGSPQSNTDLCLALKERLRERGPLLVSPNVTSRPLVQGAASLLDEKRLEFFQCTNLLAVYTLGKSSRRNRTTCFSRPSGSKKNAIFVTEDFDLFDAGQAIGDLILKRCQLEDAFFISSLLEAPLDQLRARGFPIDRILKPEPVVVPKAPPPRPVAPPPPPIPDDAAASVGPAEGSASSVESKPAAPAAKATSQEPTEPSGSKADILMQMFPDADPNFIIAALGNNASVDDLKVLANKMATGHYPKKDEADTSTVASSHASNDGTDDLAQAKKKSLRKRLGKAFGGKRPSNFGGFQLPHPPAGQGQAAQSGGGVAAPGSSNSRVENRGPVSPAADVHTQNSLDSMLEQSVGTSTKVQNSDIDSPETQMTSIPPDLDRGDTCEVLPGHSLKPFLGPRGNGRTHNGIQVFSSKTHESSEVFLTENETSLHCFADVLQRLSVDVFALNLNAVAIYHDPAGVTIAFNRGRALHMNFRFFHALHFLQNKHITSECYSYWFVTICHELAHNFVSGHTREHGFYTESFAGKYLPKLTALLRKHNLE